MSFSCSRLARVSSYGKESKRGSAKVERDQKWDETHLLSPGIDKRLQLLFRLRNSLHGSTRPLLEQIPLTLGDVDERLLFADLGRPGFKLLLVNLNLVREIGRFV